MVILRYTRGAKENERTGRETVCVKEKLIDFFCDLSCCIFCVCLKKKKLSLPLSLFLSLTLSPSCLAETNKRESPLDGFVMTGGKKKIEGNKKLKTLSLSLSLP